MALQCLYIFSFQAIKHHKLNTKRNPCEPAKEYKYFDCIIQKTLQSLGCKPFWLDMIESELPLCSNYSSLSKYRLMTNELLNMDERTLFEKFKCLKPCSFMEYQVSFKLVGKDAFLLSGILTLKIEFVL